MSKDTYISGNERYRITISDPLLRPGLKIETEVSGKYLIKTLNYLFQEIRAFNSKEKREGGLEQKTQK